VHALVERQPHSQTRETVRDYLLLVLFPGLRREEAARLTWDNVDLKARTLTVTDAKNNQDHTLPLSDFLYELLARRKESATNGRGWGPYGGTPQADGKGDSGIRYSFHRPRLAPDIHHGGRKSRYSRIRS